MKEKLLKEASNLVGIYRSVDAAERELDAAKKRLHRLRTDLKSALRSGRLSGYLCETRDQLGLSADQAATRLGCSRQYVTMVECRVRPPSRPFIEQLEQWMLEENKKQ